MDETLSPSATTMKIHAENYSILFNKLKLETFKRLHASISILSKLEDVYYVYM